MLRILMEEGLDSFDMQDVKRFGDLPLSSKLATQEKHSITLEVKWWLLVDLEGELRYSRLTLRIWRTDQCGLSRHFREFGG